MLHFLVNSAYFSFLLFRDFFCVLIMPTRPEKAYEILFFVVSTQLFSVSHFRECFFHLQLNTINRSRRDFKFKRDDPQISERKRNDRTNNLSPPRFFYLLKTIKTFFFIISSLCIDQSHDGMKRRQKKRVSSNAKRSTPHHDFTSNPTAISHFFFHRLIFLFNFLGEKKKDFRFFSC